LPEQARIRVEGPEFVVEQRGEPSRRVGPGARVPVGRYLVRLSHQNFPAALVLDPDSPLVRSGPLPRWFPPDPAHRLRARLRPEKEPREETVLSTRGFQRRALRLGHLEAELLGKPLRLLALRLLEPGVGEAAVSVFFRDATSGRETYPVGRYLDPKPIEGAPGDYLLDFNRAYNPTCAFSGHYSCPVPPRENVLAFPVRAGELDPQPDGGQGVHSLT